ncbi:hypothetical protein ACQI4L_11360 [Mycolicibacterium litorale]|uniref:hypothetical protein n=1 Tax=Mycolicibacterium litorale TaxID=758802 RepID=UPI003CE68F2D
MPLLSRARLTPNVSVRVCAALGVLATGAIAYFVATDRLKADQAGVLCAAVLMSLILMTIVVMPAHRLSGIFRHVKSFKMAGIGVEIEAYGELAKLRTSEEPDAELPQHSDTLLDLKVRLEAKLTYLAKHVLCTDADPQHLIPTFLTVGSLSYDGFLTREQAKRAYEILGMRDNEFQGVPAGERALFLAGGNKFVDTVRAEVFGSFVRILAENAGWDARRVYPADDQRRDLLIESRSAADTLDIHHVVPVFSYRRNSALIEGARQRILKSPQTAGEGRGVIVVPPRSKAADAPERRAEPPAIAVVTSDHILNLLGAGDG